MSFIRNYTRMALLDNAGELASTDPVSGEELNEEVMEERAERSPEEDAAAATEATQDLAAATETAATIEQLELKALRLEDAAEILDNTEQADEGHVALARTVADLVADGDQEVSSEVVNPDGATTESMIGRRMSTEGFKSAAKNIWEAIKAFVKKLWAKIEGFFYKHFGRIPKMRKALKAAQERLNKSEEFPLEDKKIDITSGTSQMLIANAVVKEFTNYKASLGELKSVVDHVFGTHANKFAEEGEKIADAISNFEPEKDKAAACATEIKNAVIKALEQNIPGAGQPTFGESLVKNGYVYSASKPLPGNIELVMRRPEVRGASNLNDVSALASIRQCGLFANYPEKPKDAPSSVSITTPKREEVRDAIVVCEHMLDAMENFYRGKAFKDIKKAKEKIEKASDAASKRVEKVNVEDKSAATLPAYRAVLSFNSKFVSDVLRMFSSLQSTAMTSCAFVVSVAGKTASAYKKK